MIRVAINGFGRIGRNFLRAALQRPDIEIVAVNDLTNARTIAYLFKYDSVHGHFPGKVEHTDDALIVDGKRIQITAQRDPAQLPWKLLKVDVAVESTGLFTAREEAQKHLAAGAKKVIISAPAKNEDITIVLGVNEQKYDQANHHIISGASCTANCSAVVAKVLNDNFQVLRAGMTTVHSYTNDQKVLDLPHEEMRRGRAASLSIIPTYTGAIRVMNTVIPELKDKIDGYAMRVPTPNVSLVDFTAQVGRDVTLKEVNQVFKQAAAGKLANILAYTEEELVSVDFMSHPASAIVDASLTKVIGGQLVKVIAWYDNEMGYAARLVDLSEFIGSRL